MTLTPASTSSAPGGPGEAMLGVAEDQRVVLTTKYPDLYSFGNFSNLTYIPGEELYPVPLHVVVILTLFYVSISVAAVVGNGLVLYAVAMSRRMQSVTNCFIANLAFADVIIGLFSIPFQAALLQRWDLPTFMCPFCPFVQVLSVNVSVFTLTAIAVDRHRAVLSPLSAPPTKLRAKLTIAVIWVVSAALAAPMLVALRVSMEPDFGAFIPSGLDPLASALPPLSAKPFCSNLGLAPTTMLIYRMVLVVIQYVIPLSVISVVYTRMGMRLWGSKAPGNAEDSRDAALLRNKKKVIKMLVIVVALFAICWLPLQMYNFLQDVYPDINRYRFINIIFFSCDWLAMSNSCYNPFIYAIYNEKFQREFRLLLNVCLRRSRRNRRGSMSRELSNLDSGRWEHRALTAGTSKYGHHVGGGGAGGGGGAVGTGSSTGVSTLAVTP